jgi:hypothetical protein
MTERERARENFELHSNVANINVYNYNFYKYFFFQIDLIIKICILELENMFDMKIVFCIIHFLFRFEHSN